MPSTTSLVRARSLVTLVAVTLALAPGCELATHFGDFQPGVDAHTTTDGGTRDDGGDAGSDAGMDASMDAAFDAGMAMPDVGTHDAGPADTNLPTHAVTVTLTGPGMATLTSSDSVFSCTSAMSPCTWTVPEGSLTISSTPDATSALQTWDGACSTTAATATSCTVNVNAALALGATYRVRQVALDVGVTGLGTVTSTAPAALTINCTGGATGCSASVAAGTSITLHAAAGSGYTFSGWTVTGCTGTGDCTFTILADTHVEATFTDGRVPIRVARAGDGSGSVAADMGAISCGTTCSDLYLPGAHVVLTATATQGTDFTSWSGCPVAATGNTCAFDIPVSGTTVPVITATFTLQRFTLTVHRSGAGSGTINSASPTINCGTGAGCVAMSLGYGSTVTLSETPAGDSVFSGWSGASGCSSGTTCMLTITGPTSVTGTFGLQTVHVTFAGAGTGDGFIVTDDGIIASCLSAAGATSGTCAADYPIHSPITVRGNASTGSQFTAWSSAPGGYCSGVMSSCSFAAEEDLTITGAFGLRHYDLNATVTGTMLGGMTGMGSVSFNPGSVSSCASAVSPGNTCTNNYAYNQTVTLMASPSSGASVFAGWGGDCSAAGTNPVCVVSMLAAHNVSAAFAPNVASLNVSTSGMGQGTVTDGGGLINCPAGSCSQTYTTGTVVTLTATPNAGAGYTFSTWTGACASSGSSPTCMVTISGATNVGATFVLSQRTVTINQAGGTNPGTVSDTAGAMCSSATCMQSYPYNSRVDLTAAAGPGFVFSGWTGCPMAAGNVCTINPLTVNTAVTANYTVQIVTVSINFTGAGIGVVNGSGFTCHSQPTGGDTCSRNVPYGTPISLTATPNMGAVLTAWSGACTGAGTCAFTATNLTPTVTANIALQQFLLTVNRLPAGTTATITASSGATINCGSTCTAMVDYGTVVRLVETPSSNYRFIGWSIPSCGVNTTCDVTMTSAQTVNATFIETRTVTITIPGGSPFVGSANVSSLNFSGLNCTNPSGSSSVSCSADFDVGTPLQLGATDPSHRYYGPGTWGFSGINTGSLSCPGGAAECDFTLPSGGDRLILTVTFSQLGNIAFVSSTTYPGLNLFTNSTSYCNGRASAAGLPGSYIAFLSTAAQPFNTRLPATAQVFIRPDGRPVATSRSRFFGSAFMFPIALDEAGAVVNSTTAPATTNVWTGTTGAGDTTASTCGDWASSSLQGQYGVDTWASGPFAQAGVLSCTSNAHIYCIQTDITTTAIPRPLPPSDPVLIFLSSHTGMGNIGRGQMDTYCNSEAHAAGFIDNYIALISDSITIASTRAVLYGTLVRPDGWPLGPHFATNSVINGTGPPLTGTWAIQADGALFGGAAQSVWTGFSTTAASAAGTGCTHWTDNSSGNSSTVGFPANIAPYSWGNTGTSTCNTVDRWYCIQNQLLH